MSDLSSEESLSVQDNLLIDTQRVTKYESLLLNCICVGQWEIARALIRTLFEEKAAKNYTGELLKVLILEANEFWGESSSTPSPHHLQWLGLQEYNNLFGELEDELPEFLRTAIEFRLLLFAARDLEFYNTDVANFLCLYHDHHVVKMSVTKTTLVGTSFSRSCLQFLRNCLYDNPTLGHAIINKLICNESKENLTNNQELQGLFLKCIDGSLTSLLAPNEGSQHEQSESEGHAEFQQQYIKLTYSLLSLMDPSADMTELELDRVFLRILELSGDMELKQPGIFFDSKKIYSCLLGRKTNFLISRFQAVEEFKRKNQQRLQLQHLMINDEDENVVVHRKAFEGEKWRMLFFETLHNNQHMLEYVLLKGLQLISIGELEQLTKLMSTPEYAPMRPLLLLLGWDRYPHNGSGQELLETLRTPEGSTQPLLHAACYKLSYQVALVQWCLDKARPFLQLHSTPFQSKATEMFDGLETHSVLYVLHHSTPLACLNPVEVIEILRMRPHVPSASGGTTPPYPFSGSATPTKHVAATPTFLASTPSVEMNKLRATTPSPTSLSGFHYPQKLKPEQERDIAIYQAFCAIKLVMDALYLCANKKSSQLRQDESSLKQPSSRKRTVSSRRRLISGSDKEQIEVVKSLDLPLLQDNPDESFELGIKKRLHKAADFLSQIQPLNFRLEILENIFSLLFLKYEDITEYKKLSAFDTGLLMNSDTQEGEPMQNEKQALEMLQQQLNQDAPSLFSTGFIVSEQLADELLTILQDCLLDLTSAKFAMRRQSSISGMQITEQASSTEPMLENTHMNCAIVQSSLHQHNTRLKHYINEAKWRLQLITSKMVMKQERSSDDESDEYLSAGQYLSSPDVKDEEMTSIEASSASVKRLFSKSEEASNVDELFVPQLQRSESSLSHASNKVDEASQLQPVKEDSGVEADNEEAIEVLKKKSLTSKRTRSSSKFNNTEEAGKSLSPSHVKTPTQTNQDVISSMLASPQSLLFMCLQQGNYDKAKEILKMFNMEGQLGEALVLFTESYIAIKEEFRQTSRFITPKTSPQVYNYMDSRSSGETTPDSNKSSTPTVESLKLLGATKKETPNIALQTALLTCTTVAPPLDSIHKLLASPFINGMLFAGDSDSEAQVTAIPILHSLTQHMPTLILLDILCTNSMSGDVARRLVAMAAQRCGQIIGTIPSSWNNQTSVDPAGLDLLTDLPTPLAVLNIFINLSAFYATLPSTLNAAKSKLDAGFTLVKNFVCPFDFINGYHYIFRSNTIVHYCRFMEQLHEQFGTLEVIIEQVTAENLDVLEYAKTAKANKPGTTSKQRKAIEALIASLDKGWSGMDELNETTEGRRVNYLQALYKHLGDVASMLKMLFTVYDGTITTGVVTTGMQEMPRPLVMLGDSPTHILGRMIFEKKFPPEMLDSFAYNLRMNLVEVIVKGCCPPIESKPATPTRSATPTVAGLAGSLKSSVFPVVLNSQEALSSQLDPTNLCDLSFNLLNRMMAVIKDIPRSAGGYVGLKEVSYVSNYPDVITAMADTHLLADVDLQLLDNDNKKMVFFANVVNLLYCHCLLLYGLYQAETTAIELPSALVPLFSSIEDGSWLSHLNLFSCVGYRIGQLGLISCLDLHYCILLHGLSPYTPELPHPFSCVLTDNDPWLKHCCSAPANPQLLFVVGNAWISSPFPRPLHLEDSELELAEQDYLDSVVTIDTDSNQVTVSRLLHDHCNVFVRSSDSHQASSVDTALLKYLLRKLPSQSSATLKQLMEEASTPAKLRKGAPPSSSIKVTVKKHKLKFGYLLPSTVSTPLLRSYSLASGSPVLSRSTSQVDPSSIPTKSLHNLNSRTLQYIQQRFGLIASLLQLLCQVDNSGEAKSPTTTEEPEDTKESKPVKTPSLFKSLKAQTPSKEQKGKQLGEVPLKRQKKWSESYTELLECFNHYSPFRAYMESRVSPFEEILYFHAIEKPLEGGHSKRLNRHPPVADIGLASSQSKVLYDATSYGLQRLAKNKEFYKALDMLSSEPLINCAEDSFLVALKQTILRVTFLCLLDKGDAPNPVSLLARLNDHDVCARLALQSVRHWPIGTCVDVLSMCSSRLPMDSALLSVVNTELKRMKIYSEIMFLCNQEDEVKDSTDGESISSVKWLSWTRLADDSASKPKSVLGQLITLKQYELARQWAMMHNVAQNLKEWIEVQYLLDMLTESNASKARAQQVLDGLCDDACRLSVCKALLNKSKLDFTSQLFLLHYIILKLASLLEKQEMENYANHALGIKALLCLPESSWLEFSSLVSEPFTLTEQLLMNMKLEWAASVITCLRDNEMYCHLNSSGGPGVDHLDEKPFTTDCIDQLLTYYSLKALEFPPPVILTPQEAFTVEQSMMSSRQMTPSLSRIPSPLHHHRSRTMTTIQEQKGDSSVAENQETFQPPPVPPPSHKWEQDSRVTKCRVCKVIFGLFNRRHHCRRCGRVVCSNCSPKQMTVDSYNRPQRVCTDCYNFRFPPKLSSEDDSDREAGDQTKPSLPQAAVIPPDLSLPYTFNRCRLKAGDHLTNVEIRSDFNYHGSPDCPLFISLLELHSDRKQCADFILDRAHVVSLQLMPNDRGQLNEEIDKQFVVGIIRYLLISAKVKFSTAGCHDSVELCDTYLSRVDLLKMFVSSNYKKIPSIQELTQQDSSRRIRDQLLHDDRFSLAMEISTKCNLDTIGVWAAWGMSWLKVGDFEKAREKLRHCFMQNLQSMGTMSQNATLLGRVIEAIESAPLAAIHEPQDEWSTVIHAAMMLLEKQDQCFLDKYRYDECMYYLKNYGSQSAKVSFLFKHGFVQKACKYILEQQCSTDLFLEALLIPALKRGQFDAIKNELRMCDPSLKLWEPHLVVACRYFSRRQLFAILYEMQIFMKDFIRASMTCIKFYTGFSGKLTSITDLYNRIAYLYKAEEHLKAYQEAKAAKPATDLRTHLAARLGATGHEEGLAVMAMTTEEIVRHISSIKLQVEVTEYLYKCFTKRGGRDGSVPMVTVQQMQQPATLFGGTPVRLQVACQVLLWSSTIDNGFPLVIRILKAFYLPRGKFFSQVASTLTANSRTADIHHLLECVKANDQNHAMYTDDIILAAVKELAKTPNNEPKEIDKLVLLLNSDVSKINAFIQCGKLKSAYLTAIKGRYVEEVKRISTIATQAGQTAIRDICDRWLQMNASNKT